MKYFQISQEKSEGVQVFRCGWAKAKAVSSHSDSDGMGSIPASPDALSVPLLLCQERFNEASLPG